MTRFAGLALLSLVAFVVALPAHAQFAEGWSLVPEACRDCPAAWGCVIEIANNLVTFAMSIGVTIVIVVIAYAGILLVLTPTNPENKSQAKKMLINAVIGLVIVLSAWLLVDKLLEVLGAGNVSDTTAVLGVGGASCYEIPELETPDGVGEVPAPGDPGGGGGGSGSNCPAADASTMVAFPAAATDGGAEKATATTVQNFLSMREAALAEGINIKVTDGYRSDAEQVALWNRYGQDTSQVAKPCSLGGGGSNHNSGVALDLTVGCKKTNTSCNSDQYNWLKANGSKWNFRNALPRDTVHWSPSGH